MAFSVVGGGLILVRLFLPAEFPLIAQMTHPVRTAGIITGFHRPWFFRKILNLRLYRIEYEFTFAGRKYVAFAYHHGSAYRLPVPLKVKGRWITDVRLHKKMKIDVVFEEQAPQTARVPGMRRSVPGRLNLIWLFIPLYGLLGMFRNVRRLTGEFILLGRIRRGILTRGELVDGSVSKKTVLTRKRRQRIQFRISHLTYRFIDQEGRERRFRAPPQPNKMSATQLLADPPRKAPPWHELYRGERTIPVLYDPRDPEWIRASYQLPRYVSINGDDHLELHSPDFAWASFVSLGLTLFGLGAILQYLNTIPW